ncbi:hypothetical protein CPB84DRAFT_1782781 [Gymnopilus junonius]|uniref:Uncharacterized protein n=1 Tax=Gymnopilus junonius TaxID=109634 RepID=A0A9P5NI47_GYMJU|nr:hypothetical protein CPB84DRAFT_1782781 [Gymnopilus junonius]
MTSMKNFSWRASNQIIRPNVDENSGRVVLLTKHEQFSVVDLAKYTVFLLLNARNKLTPYNRVKQSGSQRASMGIGHNSLH